MPFPLCSPRLATILAALAFAALPAHAVSVIVSYELTRGSASIDPITVPNPQGGEPLTVTPSLTIDSGSFEAVFENGTPLGTVADGPATIRGLGFSGSISIAVSTVIDLGIISPMVTADLDGPLTGSQISDSLGSILGGGTLFANTSPGNFNVTAGPLECSDSLLGIVCGLFEGALGLSFPLEIPAVDNAPLPFTGGFAGLDTPGSSTAGNTFEFSVPIDDTNSFGVELDIQWSETDRLVVPEPSTPLLASLALLFLSRRRRSIA